MLPGSMRDWNFVSDREINGECIMQSRLQRVKDLMLVLGLNETIDLLSMAKCSLVLSHVEERG